MEPVDSFRIPLRYNFTIEKLKKGNRFDYLQFDGTNFMVPVDKVKQFYFDLRELLPKGERIERILVKMSGFFERWKSTIKDDDIEGIPDSVEEELDFEFIEDFISKEQPRELSPPPDVEGKKDIVFKIRFE